MTVDEAWDEAERLWAENQQRALDRAVLLELGMRLLRWRRNAFEARLNTVRLAQERLIEAQREHTRAVDLLETIVRFGGAM